MNSNASTYQTCPATYLRFERDATLPLQAPHARRCFLRQLFMRRDADAVAVFQGAEHSQLPSCCFRAGAVARKDEGSAFLPARAAELFVVAELGASLGVPALVGTYK
jgi:hypothetical protein